MYHIRERIKDLEIFDGLSYEQVRDKIMSKELSVNTVVTIDERDRIKIFYSKLVPLPGPHKYYEYSILHLTLYLNDDNFVDFLLENNADTKLETEYLAPVILLAISLNHLKYVKKLVTAGADINQIICVKGKFGTNSDRLNDNNVNPCFLFDEFTPLEFAVNLDEYEIAEFLITHGADVHIRSGNNGKNSDSPMGIAASSDNIEMLKLLIKHGADINAGDDNGLTPLMKAVKNNNSASIKFLLSQPLIEVNSLANDKTFCLHFSGVLDNIYTFNYIERFRCNLQDLLNAGCDVNIQRKHRRLPINTYSMERKCLSVLVKHLMKLMVAGLYVCIENRITDSGRNVGVKNLRILVLILNFEVFRVILG
ncbi:GSCOCG00011205001-RA-CDS [Cotesia congregata]|nr:GSCOCG00011205001-RA-CDS [Cotesia congregata]